MDKDSKAQRNQGLSRGGGPRPQASASLSRAVGGLADVVVLGKLRVPCGQQPQVQGHVWGWVHKGIYLSFTPCPCSPTACLCQAVDGTEEGKGYPAPVGTCPLTGVETEAQGFRLPVEAEFGLGSWCSLPLRCCLFLLVRSSAQCDHGHRTVSPLSGLVSSSVKWDSRVLADSRSF